VSGAHSATDDLPAPPPVFLLRQHENEIARAQKTVASGLADMTKAQTEATRANEDVAAARAVVADATRALDAKLEAREKIALRLTAVSAEVEKAKGIVAQRTKEKEGTAVQVVKAKIAMDKARKDAMRAAESVTLPPLPFR
jgi:hypothetical protein|tara:strand:+ start:389 stop:811 length:423 start_codon:yes stop_codon:yes gene_type:complete